jgi:pimeloyl-ACP methyl ester carboxylesterase
VIFESKVARAILMSVSASPDFARTSEWLERDISRSKFPTMIIWGREDEVFDAATFSSRFKQMMSHAEGPHRVTGRHFLVSGAEIAWLIGSFLDRPDNK